ncbi:DUF350 domain-containing protein [Xanthovirga aplysinae]|uniref:DUF350 domain-containing protein n=1 Tax=Xanthovirga aplysinae TaxID=2529853 RepID=UPI0012BC2059|nr:DUF350 domain-containing protein [Xanthovirga aplysinae]MTI32315.1 DUF350 domain-containing protein [Xanthovirga aplysinae]
MNQIIDNSLSSIIYLISCFILLLFGKWIYQLFNKNIKVQEELVEKDNFAFAVAFTGYLVGLLIALGGGAIGESGDLVNELIDLFIYGVLGVILLNLSVVFNDKVILSKFSVYKEIVHDRNVGSGVVEGAMAISTGLIIFGAISGEGGGVLVAVVYWAVGQLILLLTSFIYNLITPYDVHEHIERDNVAAGVGFAGALIAIANLIRFALAHDFISWEYAAQDVFLDAGIGLIFLPIARLIADKIFLPGRNLTDEIINQEHPNVGAGLIEAFAYIGSSVLICWSLA